MPASQYSVVTWDCKLSQAGYLTGPGPAHAPLGVQVKVVALMGQDELADRPQASIVVRLASSEQAAWCTIVQVFVAL